MTRAELKDILTDTPLDHIRQECTSIRLASFDRNVEVCSILNARNGGCSEDCAYCAQSGTAGSGFVDASEVRAAHGRASKAGVGRFSIVASGRGIENGELPLIHSMISTGVDLCPMCASLGIAGRAALESLREAGITRYHHNLETSRDHFGNICTTHDWDERYRTAELAREAGLSLCSGGIMGIGETDGDRIDLALALGDLEVDSVALNFFIRVEGSRLAGERLSFEKALRIVAMFRMALPRSELRLCAGRMALGDHLSSVFDFGVTGIMSGDLLTTPGSLPVQDLSLIEGAGYSA